MSYLRVCPGSGWPSKTMASNSAGMGECGICFRWVDVGPGNQCYTHAAPDSEGQPQAAAAQPPPDFASAIAAAQQEARAERDRVWKAAVLGARKCGSTHSNMCACHDLRALLEGK